MSTFMQDLRYAARVLAKSPGFALVALAALGLGIGANTAIFTVFYSVLMKPLDYPESDRLMMLVRHFPGGNAESLSGKKYLYAREHAKGFAELGAQDVLGTGVNLTGQGDPERIPSMRVTASWFNVLGVAPALGRAFTDDEDRPSGPCLAVLTHGIWQRRFGADRTVLGRPLTLGGQSCTVTGVMPPGFKSSPEADIYTPLGIVDDPTDRANMYFILARLNPGVTWEQAEQQTRALHARFVGEFPTLRDGDHENFTLLSYREFRTGSARTALMLLLASVGLVLLIACANVANLLLARATGRQREMAIRAAMGASGKRIARQLLTESVLLSLAGGALGLLLAHWGLKALLVLGAGSLPRSGDIRIEAPVLLFTVAISALTGVIFGLTPALQAMRTDLNLVLREGTGRAGGGRGRHSLRSALVTVEVALSVVLLAGALLLVRTFQNLRNVDPGFRATNVVTFQSALGARYKTSAQIGDYLRQVQERIEITPGVVAAGVTTNLPTEIGPDIPCDIVGRGNTDCNAQWRHATPHFIEAMGIRLIAGRTFRETDTAAAEPVIIVNESFARTHFKDRSAIGERIVIGRIMGPSWTDKARQIVGVVGDVREQGLDTQAPPIYYVPSQQVPDIYMQKLKDLLPMAWVVRTSGDPLQMTNAIRAAVMAVDRDQPMSNVRTLESVVAASLAQRQFHTWLLSLFALLALALAAVGIYGVLSYSVNQRRSEIGVRLALGATATDVIGLVLRESMRPALAGIAIGLVSAFMLTRWMESLLVGVSARDPLSFFAVPLVLLLVVLFAALQPAWRAVRIDPVVALRYE